MSEIVITERKKAVSQVSVTFINLLEKKLHKYLRKHLYINNTIT